MPALHSWPTQTVLPTIVPGLVFGILSVLGFIFFSLWLCTQCCGRRRRVRASPDKAQLMASAEQQVRRSGGKAGLVSLPDSRCSGLVDMQSLAAPAHPKPPRLPAWPRALATIDACRATATRRRHRRAGGTAAGRGPPSS